MLIGQFKGKSLIPSQVIRFLTRSEYSHSAFIFDGPAEAAAIKLITKGYHMGRLTDIAQWSVVEAWNPVVRNTLSVRDGHVAGTAVDIFEFVVPLAFTQEQELIQGLIPEIGIPYDWTNVLKFLSKEPAVDNNAWFCSELVYQKLWDIGKPLLARTPANRVPPDWIARSPLLRYAKTIYA